MHHYLNRQFNENLDNVFAWDMHKMLFSQIQTAEAPACLLSCAGLARPCCFLMHIYIVNKLPTGNLCTSSMVLSYILLYMVGYTFRIFFFAWNGPIDLIVCWSGRVVYCITLGFVDLFVGIQDHWNSVAEMEKVVCILSWVITCIKDSVLQEIALFDCALIQKVCFGEAREAEEGGWAQLSICGHLNTSTPINCLDFRCCSPVWPCFLSVFSVNGAERGQIKALGPQIKNPDSLRARITGLSANHNYRFYVWARTNTGRGEPVFLDVRTKDGERKCHKFFLVFRVRLLMVNGCTW